MSKGFENISGLRSGTFSEVLGYAGAEGPIFPFPKLTIFQGFHTLLGLRSSTDPHLPGYMRVIEFFLVQSWPCKITGIAVRAVSLTTTRRSHSLGSGIFTLRKRYVTAHERSIKPDLLTRQRTPLLLPGRSILHLPRRMVRKRSH